MGIGPRGITYGGLGNLGMFLGTGGATINVQSTAAGATRSSSNSRKDKTPQIC